MNNEQVLFDAINQNNAFLVKQYVDMGGSVAVRSKRGFTPLAETAMMLHREKMNDPNDLPPPAPVSVDAGESSLSKEAQSSLEIGVILLSAGCSLEDRMGKTNRTVTVAQFMKTSFPDILQSWNAVWSGQQIRQEISETVDIEARPVLGPRKI